jgi:hypothetical protein
VKGHATDVTAVGQPRTVGRRLKTAPDRLDRASAVFHDVGVRPSTRILENASQLLTDRHDLWAPDPRHRLVPTDGDETEGGVDVLAPRQRQHACQSQLGRQGRDGDGQADVIAKLAAANHLRSSSTVTVTVRSITVSDMIHHPNGHEALLMRYNARSFANTRSFGLLKRLPSNRDTTCVSE